MPERRGIVLDFHGGEGKAGRMPHAALPFLLFLCVSLLMGCLFLHAQDASWKAVDEGRQICFFL